MNYKDLIELQELHELQDFLCLLWHKKIRISITYVHQSQYAKHDIIYYTEAVVHRCSVKKMLLKISQNSQENTCAGMQLY